MNDQENNLSCSNQSLVLLIDDEEMLLQLAQQFLEMAGLKTKGFSNSQEGINWYLENSEKVSLAILDMKMDGLDGQACFEKILECNPEAKIAFLTGLAEPEVESKLIGKGAVGFLRKPLRYPDLVEWVKSKI
jgi:FixJ family two-component response regulator